MRPDWWPNWEGQCAAIVGGGPSLTQAQVDKLKDRIHVVVVNTSYNLCLWADVLYSCDAIWWKYRNGAGDFKGLKVTQDDDALAIFPELRKITVKRDGVKIIHDFLMDTYGEVGGGGNSGFQTLNWLAQIGVKGILLLGIDMRTDGNGKNHWHGRHPDSGKFVMNNPSESNYRFWIENMTAAAPKIKALGIDVVNCSPTSALECFPKMTVDQALERWRL